MKKQAIKFVTMFFLLVIYSNNVFMLNTDGTKNNKKHSADSNLVDQDWYSTIIKKLQKKEYNISYSEKIKSYQSPNRKNNLRFIYKINGFSVKPRMTEISFNNEKIIQHKETKEKNIKRLKDWNAEFTVIGYGRNNKVEKTFGGKELIVKNNIAYVQDKNMRIDYINNEEGMRQNFMIHNRPKKGKGHLGLRIKIKTEKRVVVGANALLIRDDETEFMKYSSLKIWDSKGKELRGWFSKIDNLANNYTKEIQIVVNDKGAVYPITIDPLSTTYNWSTESNQIGAFLGESNATAGDVNGDGYSDVIVGVSHYDNGEENEGTVFVYHGSAIGLSTTADWTTESNQIGGGLGNSVSTAGDVNGDGYSDVIVGANNFDNGELNEGAAYVYHGSSSGLLTTESWFSEGNQTDAGFGNSVSTAGDVNGDGYSDVIVGAPLYDSEKGAVWVYYGSASGLSTSADAGFEGSVGDHFGISVSTAGDVNGDGYSDIIVGANLFDNGETDEGAAFVYHGSASGLSFTADWSTESNQINSNFGHNVAVAGDVNGDGYSDIIVGANNFDNGENNEGAAFVYYGSASGLSNNFDWSAEINMDYAFFGSGVATAGDVNGDGYSDIIVGAYGYSNGESSEGAAFLYKGSAGGLSNNSNWATESNQVSSGFGQSVSTAGDVNGDGYSDIVVGAYLFDNGELDEGATFAYYGSSSGLSTVFSWTDESNQNGARFGSSVSTAGDVNGDGYSDIIVGAENYTNGENFEGAVFVYHGSSSGLSTTPNLIIEGNVESEGLGISVSTAGDVNGDGYSDIIVGAETLYKHGKAIVFHGSSSGLSTIAAWTAEGGPQERFGHSVSTAGDVNGDGYSDIIVGRYHDAGAVDDETVFVYHGSSNGLSTIANWTARGNATIQFLGVSVSTAGDVNGDGYSDVIVGAHTYDNNTNTDGGRVFVYLGSKNGLRTTYDWSKGKIQDLAYFGRSVSSAGDVNGDGYSDVIVGGNGYDNGETDEGIANVFYGNERGGLKARLRQYRPNSTDLIGPGGLSQSDGEVRFRTGGKSPFGRADGRIVYEYKYNGQEFSSGNNKITNSVDYSGKGSFNDLGSTNITGSPLTVDLSGLQTNNAYKWRARVEYSIVNNPYQKYGPWRYYNNFEVNFSEGFKPMITGISPILIDIKIFLEGPYNSSETKMDANLAIPNTSPYPKDPVFVNPIPNNVVDWVFVELRDKDDSSIIISSRSAFIKKSGLIVDLDGSSSLQFSKPIGDYYIVVKHRNHLGVMSSSTVNLTN